MKHASWTSLLLCVSPTSAITASKISCSFLSYETKTASGVNLASELDDRFWEFWALAAFLATYAFGLSTVDDSELKIASSTSFGSDRNHFMYYPVILSMSRTDSYSIPSVFKLTYCWISNLLLLSTNARKRHIVISPCAETCPGAVSWKPPPLTSITFFKLVGFITSFELSNGAPAALPKRDPMIDP